MESWVDILYLSLHTPLYTVELFQGYRSLPWNTGRKKRFNAFELQMCKTGFLPVLSGSLGWIQRSRAKAPGAQSPWLLRTAKNNARAAVWWWYGRFTKLSENRGKSLLMETVGASASWPPTVSPTAVFQTSWWGGPPIAGMGDAAGAVPQRGGWEG